MKTNVATKPWRMTILASLLSLGVAAHLDAMAQAGGAGGNAGGGAAAAPGGNAGQGQGAAPSGHNQSDAADRAPNNTGTVRTRDKDAIEANTQAGREQGRDSVNRQSANNDDWQRTHRLSKVIGADVRDASGKEVGEIEDVVLDRRGRSIAYAVVSTGGFAGLGEKLVAVPWNRIRMDRGGDYYVLNINADRLKDAPNFDENAWPDMAGDRSWNGKVDSWWNRQREQSGGTAGKPKA